MAEIVCVSQAPFDYLHGKYNDLGIIWIDAHPDVSTINDGYPNAHAMVLGSLMGHGDNALSGLMKNEKFKADEYYTSDFRKFMITKRIF